MNERSNYMKLAWDDVRHSQGWRSKSLIFGLLSFVPVFGPMVLYGYAYGWARDVAWGVREPLPRRVFGNEDGRLYSRGFYVFVLFFVCGLIPMVASSLLAGITGMHGVAFLGFWQGHGMMPLAWFSSSIGLVTFVLTIALSLAVFLFAVVGSVRIALYDRMSAGFQFGKIWAMIRRDTHGIMGILGRTVLAIALIIVASCVVFLLVALLAALFGAILFGGLSGLSHYDSHGIGLMLLVMAFVGIMLLAFAAVGVLCAAASSCVALVVARAAGLWVYQFDVASWRGQDDPLPFETDPRV